MFETPPFACLSLCVQSAGEEVIAVIESDDRLDQKKCFLWACPENKMADQAVKVPVCCTSGSHAKTAFNRILPCVVY